jgi:site-specific recombinase XerD
MMFSPNDIKNDTAFRDFIKRRRVADTTHKQYIKRMKSYCNFTKKLPNELINEAEEEQDAGIKSRNRKTTRYILDYVDAMEKAGQSENTIRNSIDTVTGFYHEYDIDTPRIRGLSKLNGKNASLNELPKAEHVKEALKNCSLRDKAIVLLHFSSGMGASEVRHLTYKDFLNSLEEYLDLEERDRLDVKKIAHQLKGRDDLIGTWKIRRYKTGMPYITFNSPESTRAILDYLMSREKRNKKLKNLDDYLFVNNNNKQISETGHILIFQRINDRARFGYRENKRRFFTSHQLRAMFQSTLYRAGIDKLAIDWMAGHKINEVDEAYFKVDPKDLKTRYMEALKHLTLTEVKVERVSTPEYDRLLHDSREKDEKISTLEDRLNIVENLLGDPEFAKKYAKKIEENKK